MKSCPRPGKLEEGLLSSASDFLVPAAIDLRHAAPETLRFFLGRKLAGQLPDPGGQTAAFCVLGIIELLSLTD